MVTALPHGLGAAVPLPIGVAIGLRWTLPRAVLGTPMAFGAGTMIAAVSEELSSPRSVRLRAGRARLNWPLNTRSAATFR
ncbi:hypothetical protein [Nocardia rhizosphaerae]|uniref:Sulfate permease family protein n=1 Tax=Nocardia rhizosphaerae TaxID=1691571 RepID=A0ABV8L749_9NOCA